MFDGLTDINAVITFLHSQEQFFNSFLFSTSFTVFFKGTKASKNPWQANTLEWTTPVERIHGNWPGELPTVHRWAYDYSKPGADKDFILQTEPLKRGRERALISYA